MTRPLNHQALYYPFHLCHERTLFRLLDEYSSVHFRDYMALQLTPMSGTTAYRDRMGDYFGELLRSGRIVQGHPVSGPLDAEAVTAIDRDLADGTWRQRFHGGLLADRRFQRGLFDLSHGMWIGGTMVPGPAAWLRLTEESRRLRAYSMQQLVRLGERRVSGEEAYDYEYALALVKTSAALMYTVRLCRQFGLEAVTDCETHFQLLEHTCTRDGISLTNHPIEREGY